MAYSTYYFKDMMTDLMLDVTQVRDDLLSINADLSTLLVAVQSEIYGALNDINNNVTGLVQATEAVGTDEIRVKVIT